MIEFLISNFHFIVYSFEIVAALIGIILYSKFKNSFSKYLICFLSYVVIVEIVGYLLAIYRNHELLIFIKNAGIRGSNWWYTIFWSVGSILFFLFYYHGILKSKRNKMIIKVVSILFSVIALIFLIMKSNLISHSFSSFFTNNGSLFFINMFDIIFY